MQLSNRRVEIKGKVRDSRSTAEGPGRDNDVVGDEKVISDVEPIPPIARLQPIDVGEGSDRKVESFGVRRQVVGDLVLGRIRPSWTRER
jgi:hypothetical protein